MDTNSPSTVRPDLGLPPGWSELSTGTMLDQFRIVRVLGRGGMGAVYEADDTLLHRRVAIKVIPQTAGQTSLLREARAAAALDNPNVVRVFHVGRWSGGEYLVLELVTGGSLQDRLASGPIPWRVATWAVSEACRGLTAAHSVGLIHRDIKPANLMCGTGVVKVADFGLVRGGDLTASTSNHVAGTPHYMSPEQCRGEAADARSDIYALGATYFHLLTRRTPFTDPTPALVMFAHCTRMAPDVRELISDLPEGCASIVRKAMAREPADRFQSAKEMLAALQSLGNSAESVHTLPPRPLLPLAAEQRAWSRTTRIGLVAVLAVAVGIGSTSWFLSGRGGNEKEKDRKDKVLVSLGGEESPQRKPGLSEAFDPSIPRQGRVIRLGGKVKAVAFSRDGMYLAAGVADKPSGAVVWELATGKVARWLDWGNIQGLLFHRGRDNNCLMGGGGRGTRFWHSDTGNDMHALEGWRPEWGEISAVASKEQWAFAQAIGGVVHVYQFDGGKIGQFGKDGSPGVSQIQFAPKAGDKTLAIACLNGDLYLWDSEAGNVLRRMPQGTPNDPPVIAFAPVGDLLAVAVREKIRFLAYPAPTESGPRLQLAGGLEPQITALAFSSDGKYLASADREGGVTLWDVGGRKWIHTIRHGGKAALSVAFHPNGRLLASGDEEGRLYLWDLNKEMEGN